MAGWSMVAADEEEDAVDFRKPSTKNLEPTEEATAVNINELVSSFRSLLESFLIEFHPADSFRPLPPMTGDGRVVDLFTLFLNVSRRGGVNAVKWDEVAEECGLGLSNSASAKLIYVKYLDSLARWLNRVGNDDGNVVELCGVVSDELMIRLKGFLCEVKRNGTTAAASREFGAELKWFVSKTKRRCDDDKELISLDSGNKECSFSPRKRKRECPLETLKWLREAAKDPCDSFIGSLPDRSKWEAYGSEEPWKQLLLFRASRTSTDPACQKIWQKIQKMHPSLYEDSAGPSYNLRERLRFDGNRFNESSSASDSSDDEDRPCALVGSEFQAEVAEWIGVTSESDPKWLGTRVWPLSKEQNNNNLLIERDPIGKGRQDPCGCQTPGSVECVRFHINTKREKLKLELGPAFYMWCFDSMGEGTLQYWTDLELKKVKLLMAFPPTLSPSFFSELRSILSSKSRAEIVSYYYNVTLLQFRANQNRMTPDEVDSDSDQYYYILAPGNGGDPTMEANTSHKPVLLTPNKKKRRR